MVTTVTLVGYYGDIGLSETDTIESEFQSLSNSFTSHMRTQTEQDINEITQLGSEIPTSRSDQGPQGIRAVLPAPQQGWMRKVCFINYQFRLFCVS